MAILSVRPHSYSIRESPSCEPEKKFIIFIKTNDTASTVESHGYLNNLEEKYKTLLSYKNYVCIYTTDEGEKNYLVFADENGIFLRAPDMSQILKDEVCYTAMATLPLTKWERFKNLFSNFKVLFKDFFITFSYFSYFSYFLALLAMWLLEWKPSTSNLGFLIFCCTFAIIATIQAK